MKVTKIPGLGRFGVYIDDVDLNTISNDEWMEIGKIHLESLVTIIRGNKIDHLTYYNLMMKWGDIRWTRPLQLYRKYGKPVKELILKRLLDSDDRRDMVNYKRWAVDRKCPGMIRISPRKNENGDSLGIFGDGELYWHSNECGDIAFTPGVSLMGVENMIGSSTGFCTTVDWYEKQSDSFKSELNEMVIVHNPRDSKKEFDDDSINTAISMMYFDDTQNTFYLTNQCPEKNNEIPLVIKSPGGLTGLHYSLPTIDYIKGMSKSESNKILSFITKELFKDEYLYHHHYQSDHDLLIFDNSITLHNRSIENGTSPNRLGYRIQFDYTKLLEDEYQPFFQDNYKKNRENNIKELRIAMS